MSQWRWHTFPLPPGLDPEAFRPAQYDARGPQVGYATSAAEQEKLYVRLRENPHRLDFGRIGLRPALSNGHEARLEDLTDTAPGRSGGRV